MESVRKASVTSAEIGVFEATTAMLQCALTSNPGDVRMPVLGIPELCTIGVHSNSMANNHERRFPRDRLDVCSDAQEF